MTIKVSRVDGVAIPAAQDRRALYSGWTTGTLVSGDGLVEAQASPNMTVKVAPITGVLIDDGVSFGEGKLVLESDASVNVTIATADATNPRIDLVVAKVTAVEFGGADAFTIEAVTGTPAASPAVPAVPTRCFALAQVRVEAGITTIQAAKITDRRFLSTQVARVGVRLHKSASSVATGTATAISWTDEEEDTDGFWTSGTTITIPSNKPGIYLVTFITFGPFTGSGFRHFVSLNTTTPYGYFRQPMEATEDHGLVTASIPFSGGESFTCQVYHSTGSSVTFESWVFCHRVA